MSTPSLHDLLSSTEINRGTTNSLSRVDYELNSLEIIKRTSIVAKLSRGSPDHKTSYAYKLH